MRKLSPQEARQIELFTQLLPLPFFMRWVRPVARYTLKKVAAVVATPYDLMEDER